MSMASTPQRNDRGITVPGIHTAVSLDKYAAAMQYGGWFTPPQSAHESRGPSYAELPRSAVSTATTFLMPPTPEHSTSQGAEHHMTGFDVDRRIQPDLPDPNIMLASRGPEYMLGSLPDLTSGCLLDQGMPWPLQATQQSLPERYSMPCITDPMSSQWQEQSPVGQGFPTSTSGLQTTLYSNGNELVSQSHCPNASYIKTSYSATVSYTHLTLPTKRIV